MQLDDVLPVWDRRERHRLTVAASPAAVWTAVDGLTWAEVPLFRVLLRLRSLGWGSLPPGERVLDTFMAAGFRELLRTADEVVFGTVTRMAAGRRGRAPSEIEIAMNFRYADGELSTETRVRGSDARARRRFAGYWFLIRPFSGLIRRIWLRAIRRRCRTT